MASIELLQIQRPDDLLIPPPLVVSNDAKALLDLLPPELASDLSDINIQGELSDIVLDKGRRGIAWAAGVRKILGGGDRLVTGEDITSIVDKLGGFGDDNRAGLEQQLHRISAVRNRQRDIIGLTMRVGRHVAGAAAMISDLLFADTTKSVLFLGEPGSGKTTIVRDVTRLLAQRCNTVIVDTSNEIAGDGDIPHVCVGQARRLMVPTLKEQGRVMVECVQNHTPDVIVIDEIGRVAEVDAARTCKQRGVRLVASAHGDLRQLVKNNELRGLVGGVETVTLGDSEARAEMKRRKQLNGKQRAKNAGRKTAKKQENDRGGGIQKRRAQRAGPPTFDIIVELRRGAYHEWRIVLDTGEAVDRILEGQQYSAQRRVRNPTTGSFHLELEEA